MPADALARERREACRYRQPRVELSDDWPAMGSRAHVHVVDPPPAAAALCRHRLEGLEERWSRFLPDSELSRLNRQPDATTLVSDDTIRLLAVARQAWQRTGGRYDPTVHDAVLAAGYRMPYAELTAAGTVLGGEGVPSAGLGSLQITGNLVRLGPDVRVDPGGIGKGLAADLLVEDLLGEGAAGALVSVGGDVRVEGTAPDDRGWGVRVDDVGGRQVGLLALTGGAVCTSSPRRRRWKTDAGESHHLIDPRTGRPALSDVAHVTVLAATGWLAESLATAIAVSGLDDTAILLADDAAAIVITTDGETHLLGGIQRWLR